MTYFHRAVGPWRPSPPPPGSATERRWTNRLIKSNTQLTTTLFIINMWVTSKQCEIDEQTNFFFVRNLHVTFDFTAKYCTRNKPLPLWNIRQKRLNFLIFCAKLVEKLNCSSAFQKNDEQCWPENSTDLAVCDGKIHQRLRLYFAFQLAFCDGKHRWTYYRVRFSE